MKKLPEVTLLFWIMKIAATTLGETAGDLLSMTLKIGYEHGSMILIGLFKERSASALTRFFPLHYALEFHMILRAENLASNGNEF